MEIRNAGRFPVPELLCLVISLVALSEISLPQSPSFIGSQTLSFSTLIFNNMTVPMVAIFNYFLIPYCVFLGMSLGAGISNGTIGAHILFGMSRKTFLINKMVAHELILFLTSAGIVILVSLVSFSSTLGNIWLVLFVLLCWITFIVCAGIFSGVVSGNAFGGALIGLILSMIPEISSVLQTGQPSSSVDFFVKGLTGGSSSIQFLGGIKFHSGFDFVIAGLGLSLLVSLSLMIIAYLFFQSRDMRAGR